MLPLAVFGDPICHSLSPKLHQLFAQQVGLNVDYRAILAPPASFPQQLREFFAQGGKGANITLPHKQRVLELVDTVEPRAQLAAAANTLTYRDDKLLADNTDGLGLLADLQRLGVLVSGADILILGAGGAAQGIVGPLLEAGAAAVTVRNRTPLRAQKLVEHFAHSKLHCYREDADARAFDIVINATASGHSESSQTLHVERQWFAKAQLAYDLSYGQAALPFVDAVQPYLPASGQVETGLGMLVGQGAVSFELWTGAAVDMRTALMQLEAQLN